MDANRFDAIARSLIANASRRSILGFAVGGTLAAAGFDAVAKKKHKKHKKKHKHTCQGDTKICGPSCIPASQCCEDADCGAHGACVDGACQCLSTTKSCQGTCIPEDDCCLAADCAAGSGETCQEGRCACPPGQQHSGGVCGVPPTCTGFEDACAQDNDCCSGYCDFSIGHICYYAANMSGRPCYDDSDCSSGTGPTCVGFVCTP